MLDDALAVRLLATFVEELDEQVQELNEDLLALERAPGDKERLRAVFRVMHTLKGASRAAGLPLIEELCHALETELSRVRDDGAALGGAQIALLFEAADALGESRDKLRAGERVPSAMLTTVLQRARNRKAPGAVAVASVTRTTASDDVSPAAPVPPLRIVNVDTVPTVEPTAAKKSLDDAPLAAATDRRDEAPRGGAHVRVSLQQVDAIASAAGEIAAMAAVLQERAEGLAALRARRRTLRRAGALDDGMDADLTRLLRSATADARDLAGVSGRLGASARRIRQRPLGELTQTLPRVARDIALDIGKEVRVLITGGDIEADRVVLEALREPLLHLVRNALDHGIESPAARVAAGKNSEGEVRIEGALRGDRLQLTVADDGQGIDLDAVRRGLNKRGLAVPSENLLLTRAIFDDGFSTREEATTLSGRGVGMGIVRAAAERMGGTVTITSKPGDGTRITIDVPISIATMRVVLVRIGEVLLGVPSAFVTRVGRVDPRKLGHIEGRAMLLSSDEPIPVTTMATLLGPPFEDAAPEGMLQLVVIETGGRSLAIVVDDLLDERELVLRPLEHAGQEATNATVGIALLGTGLVVVVLSVPALMGHSEGRTPMSRALAAATEPPRVPSRILVVDDSITSRTLEQSVLAAAGYEVLTAVDGAEGWRMLEEHTVALVVSDVEMPKMDGFGLCERIRAHPPTASLPVILVTSLDDPGNRARGLEVGADAYIAKSSFDQDTLLDTVRMLIGRSEQDQ